MSTGPGKCSGLFAETVSEHYNVAGRFDDMEVNWMYMANTRTWYLERIIWVVAGTFTLASVLLAWFHSPYWLFFTGFVGINLIIFGLTGFCLMANILYQLGARPALGAPAACCSPAAKRDADAEGT